MRKVKLIPKREVRVSGVIGFLIRRVTPFGTGAKVDCPKEYLGKKVYLIICEE